MSQTLTAILVDIVFSTNDRQALLSTDVELKLIAYIGGIAKAHNLPLLGAGMADNHVHLLVSLGETTACGSVDAHQEGLFEVDEDAGAGVGVVWLAGRVCWILDRSVARVRSAQILR